MSARAGFRNIVDDADAARFRAQGWWSDTTVSDHVRAHVRSQGDKVAYVTPDHSLTYRQLDAAADRVAAALVSTGADAGDRVAVMLPDGPTIHAVLIGAERAGLTVVGIGARAGDRELRHLLTKTAATMIVTFAEHRGADQTTLVDILRADGVPIANHVVVPRFETDEHTVLIDGQPVDATALHHAVEHERRIGPDDLFLINSTSGTTGLPKCVTHHQNRWMYFHRKAVENGALTGDDVFFGAVATPFGFGIWTSHVTPLVLGETSTAADLRRCASCSRGASRCRTCALSISSTAQARRCCSSTDRTRPA